jgi:hypothetical protein
VFAVFAVFAHYSKLLGRRHNPPDSLSPAVLDPCRALKQAESVDSLNALRQAEILDSPNALGQAEIVDSPNALGSVEIADQLNALRQAESVDSLNALGQGCVKTASTLVSGYHNAIMRAHFTL